MNSYLIGPFGSDICYEVDIPRLREYILETWEAVQITETGVSPLNWIVEETNYSALCDLQSNNTVSIYGTGGTHLSTAHIAVWYRAFVPQNCELFLYSGSQWENPLKLTTETTLEDVIRWLENP